MVDCRNCEHPYCLFVGVDRGCLVECANFLPSHKSQKPMTNADRIRAMSDEELAKILSTACLGCVVKDCKLHNYSSYGCQKAFEKWLKQPAEEE